MEELLDSFFGWLYPSGKWDFEWEVFGWFLEFLLSEDFEPRTRTFPTNRSSNLQIMLQVMTQDKDGFRPGSSSLLAGDLPSSWTRWEVLQILTGWKFWKLFHGLDEDMALISWILISSGEELTRTRVSWLYRSSKLQIVLWRWKLPRISLESSSRLAGEVSSSWKVRSSSLDLSRAGWSFLCPMESS